MSTALAHRIEEALHEEWHALRDDARYYDVAANIVRFAHRVGLLTDEQRELWLLRLSTCPGHDDEGDRSWCAYCGTCCCIEGDPCCIEGPLWACPIHGEDVNADDPANHDCKFDPRYGTPGDESYHFHRKCTACGHEWGSLHCEHDGIQSRCPGCGTRLQPRDPR